MKIAFSWQRCNIAEELFVGNPSRVPRIKFDSGSIMNALRKIYAQSSLSRPKRSINYLAESAKSYTDSLYFGDTGLAVSTKAAGGVRING